MAYIKDVQVGSDTYLIEPTLYIAPTKNGAAYTATLANFSLATGATVQAKFAATNNENATLNVNSTGAKEIHYNGDKITANQFKVNHVYTLVYDGTQWQVVGDIDTNTNTWRGIQDNLTSDSTTESLSAKQGKVLKGLIDGMDATTPAASGNATAFINSITQTDGKITSITKKNIPTVSSSTAGLAPKGTAVSTQSTSTKFLREDGTWAAPSYITNTDAKVAQSSNTEDKEFPIILKNTDNTTNETNGVKYDGEVTVNPSKSKITATTIQANSRLVASKAISQIITGTGTAGSYTNSTYHPAKWTFNTGLTATDGDIFTIKIPVAGHDYGVFMSVDNGSHYYPVVLNGTGRITTHYPVNTYLTVIFEPTGSAASMYAVAGQTSSTRITVTGGVWRVLNYYDSNSNDTGYYHRRIYPNLKAGTGSVDKYTIIMQLPNGRWSSIVQAPSWTTNSSGSVIPKDTGKSASANGFMLGHVLLMYANATYADGANIGTYNIWSAHTGLIDARYSFNLANSTGNGFVAYTPVYIVGTVSDGLFHLDTTKWWTQTLPSSDDGKVYIYIGDAYDWYRLTFTEDKPIYWYKDGALRLYAEGRGIKDITRSGTTFTATRDDGSTFTFTQRDNNTTYTFANGTNGFTVTPSGGTAQTVTVTPSIANNITGSGTANYLTKFTGAHTIDNSSICNISNIDYRIITPNYTSGGEQYYKALLAYICNNYSTADIYIGTANPNSKGPILGNIYSVEDKDSTTNLPRYSTFWFNNLHDTLETFGTHNYNYYHYTYLNDNNYTDYTVTKTGTGASGSWGISITGTAANVTDTVAIAHGGTGQTTALDAITNLGGVYLLAQGKEITASSNLDSDYKTMGTYYSPNSTRTDTLAGTVIPMGSGFKMYTIVGYRTATLRQFLAGADERLFYRSSQNTGSTWGKWYQLVRLPAGSDNKTFAAIGGATTPIYINAKGEIQEGDALKDLAYISKPTSNTTTTFLRGDGTWQTALTSHQSLNGVVHIRNNERSYTTNIGTYVGGTGKKYARIKLPDSVATLWGMYQIEVSIRYDYTNSRGGKVLINLFHTQTSPYNWQAFHAEAFGDFTDALHIYGSDGKYIYIQLTSDATQYTNISINKVLVGDTAGTKDISSIGIDWVDELPTTYQTAQVYHSVLEKGTNTSWNISISGNAATATTSKALANYYTSRPENANITHVNDGGVVHFKATSTMTSNKPSGDGSILHFYWDNENAWDSQLYIPDSSSHSMQWRSSSAAGTWDSWRTLLDTNNYTSYAVAKTAGVTAVTWDATNKKLTRTINGSTADVMTAEQMSMALELGTIASKASTSYMMFGGDDTGLGSGSPAETAKTYWANAEKVADNMITGYYNHSGAEYSLLFSKRSTYGSILKWGYNDTYLRILRIQGGTWKSTDWEKISAGYADSAGHATYLTFPSIKSETEISNGTRTYQGSGSTWTGTITSMAYAGILQVGGDLSRGWQIWARRGNTTESLHWRNPNDGATAWNEERIILDSGNYTQYTVKKDGTGASGSWGISITGTAAKATADASGNVITSTYAPLASPALTGTPTAPTAADGTNTTQIATTAFVMSQFKYNDAMEYKGVVNSDSDLPANHTHGWTYKVATAGTYAGIVCEVGDLIICNTDGTSANNAHWNVIQNNIDGAVIGPASSTDNAIARFDGKTGKIIQNSAVTIDDNNIITSNGTDINFKAYKANEGEHGIFFRDGFFSNSDSKYNLSIITYDHSSSGATPDGLSINAQDGISFCTGSNTRQEQMRIASNGKVGIGTTSPSELLHITGNLLLGNSGSKSIYYQGTKSKNSMITFLDNTSDANGNGIKIGGGGVVVVGAGESAANMSVTVTSETLYLTSDGIINIEAGGDTIANRIGMQVTSSGHIIPVKAEAKNSNAQNLGASDARWAKLYIGTTDFYGDAYTPIYWNSGVPAAVTLVQYCEFTIGSGKKGVKLTHAAFTAASYVTQIVVTSGESNLNSTIAWESAAGYINLTCSATSGAVSGYILVSRGEAITATATDIT